MYSSHHPSSSSSTGGGNGRGGREEPSSSKRPNRRNRRGGKKHLEREAERQRNQQSDAAALSRALAQAQEAAQAKAKLAAAVSHAWVSAKGDMYLPNPDMTWKSNIVPQGAALGTQFSGVGEGGSVGGVGSGGGGFGSGGLGFGSGSGGFGSGNGGYGSGNGGGFGNSGSSFGSGGGGGGGGFGNSGSGFGSGGGGSGFGRQQDYQEAEPGTSGLGYGSNHGVSDGGITYGKPYPPPPPPPPPPKETGPRWNPESDGANMGHQNFSWARAEEDDDPDELYARRGSRSPQPNNLYPEDVPLPIFRVDDRSKEEEKERLFESRRRRRSSSSPRERRRYRRSPSPLSSPMKPSETEMTLLSRSRQMNQEVDNAIKSMKKRGYDISLAPRKEVDTGDLFQGYLSPPRKPDSPAPPMEPPRPKEPNNDNLKEKLTELLKEMGIEKAQELMSQPSQATPSFTSSFSDGFKAPGVPKLPKAPKPPELTKLDTWEYPTPRVTGIPNSMSREDPFEVPRVSMPTRDEPRRPPIERPQEGPSSLVMSSATGFGSSMSDPSFGSSVSDNPAIPVYGGGAAAGGRSDDQEGGMDDSRRRDISQALDNILGEKNSLMRLESHGSGRDAAAPNRALSPVSEFLRKVNAPKVYGKDSEKRGRKSPRRDQRGQSPQRRDRREKSPQRRSRKSQEKKRNHQDRRKEEENRLIKTMEEEAIRAEIQQQNAMEREARMKEEELIRAQERAQRLVREEEERKKIEEEKRFREEEEERRRREDRKRREEESDWRAESARIEEEMREKSRIAEEKRREADLLEEEIRRERELRNKKGRSNERSRSPTRHRSKEGSRSPEYKTTPDKEESQNDEMTEHEKMIEERRLQREAEHKKRLEEEKRRLEEMEAQAKFERDEQVRKEMMAAQRLLEEEKRKKKEFEDAKARAEEDARIMARKLFAQTVNQELSMPAMPMISAPKAAPVEEQAMEFNPDAFVNSMSSFLQDEKSSKNGRGDRSRGRRGSGSADRERRRRSKSPGRDRSSRSPKSEKSIGVHVKEVKRLWNATERVTQTLVLDVAKDIKKRLSDYHAGKFEYAIIVLRSESLEHFNSFVRDFKQMYEKPYTVLSNWVEKDDRQRVHDPFEPDEDCQVLITSGYTPLLKSDVRIVFGLGILDRTAHGPEEELALFIEFLQAISENSKYHTVIGSLWLDKNLISQANAVVKWSETPEGSKLLRNQLSDNLMASARDYNDRGYKAPKPKPSKVSINFQWAPSTSCSSDSFNSTFEDILEEAEGIIAKRNSRTAGVILVDTRDTDGFRALFERLKEHTRCPNIFCRYNSKSLDKVQEALNCPKSTDILFTNDFYPLKGKRVTRLVGVMRPAADAAAAEAAMEKWKSYFDAIKGENGGSLQADLILEAGNGDNATGLHRWCDKYKDDTLMDITWDPEMSLSSDPSLGFKLHYLWGNKSKVKIDGFLMRSVKELDALPEPLTVAVILPGRRKADFSSLKESMLENFQDNLNFRISEESSKTEQLLPGIELDHNNPGKTSVLVTNLFEPILNHDNVRLLSVLPPDSPDLVELLLGLYVEYLESARDRKKTVEMTLVLVGESKPEVLVRFGDWLKGDGSIFVKGKVPKTLNPAIRQARRKKHKTEKESEYQARIIAKYGKPIKTTLDYRAFKKSYFVGDTITKEALNRLIKDVEAQLKQMDQNDDCVNRSVAVILVTEQESIFEHAVAEFTGQIDSYPVLAMFEKKPMRGVRKALELECKKNLSVFITNDLYPLAKQTIQHVIGLLPCDDKGEREQFKQWKSYFTEVNKGKGLFAQLWVSTENKALCQELRKTYENRSSQIGMETLPEEILAAGEPELPIVSDLVPKETELLDDTGLEDRHDILVFKLGDKEDPVRSCVKTLKTWSNLNPDLPRASVVLVLDGGDLDPHVRYLRKALGQKRVVGVLDDAKLDFGVRESLAIPPEADVLVTNGLVPLQDRDVREVFCLGWPEATPFEILAKYLDYAIGESHLSRSFSATSLWLQDPSPEWLKASKEWLEGRGKKVAEVVWKAFAERKRARSEDDEGEERNKKTKVQNGESEESVDANEKADEMTEDNDGEIDMSDFVTVDSA